MSRRGLFIRMSLLSVLLSLGGPIGAEGCGTGTVDESSAGSSDLKLSSDDITSGEAISSNHSHTSCKGSNLSPQLGWSGDAPTGTKSYAVTVLDSSLSDAVHWILYNLSTNTTSLSRGTSLPSGAKTTENVFEESGYGGPCPPAGEQHTYQFKVWAIDVEDLSTVTNFDATDNAKIIQAIKDHDLGSANFTATFTGT